jgi:hypothetical protein
MQFLSDGRYIANVVGGKLQFYGRRDRARSEEHHQLKRCAYEATEGSENCPDSTIVVETNPLETS